jgi:hypothetical protein
MYGAELVASAIEDDLNPDGLAHLAGWLKWLRRYRYWNRCTPSPFSPHLGDSIYCASTSGGGIVVWPRYFLFW